MKAKHKDLQEVAIAWLYGVGCSIFAKEVPTQNGIADALGVKTLHGKNDVYYLECKASRSDLICKKQKQIYETAIGGVVKKCYIHSFKNLEGKFNLDGYEDCGRCKELAIGAGDTGVDFYYLVVADGVKVEPSLYPTFGVINEKGEIKRKAKRMKKNQTKVTDIIVAVAHVLVYKAYGKIYIGERIA